MATAAVAKGGGEVKQQDYDDLNRLFDLFENWWRRGGGFTRRRLDDEVAGATFVVYRVAGSPLVNRACDRLIAASSDSSQFCRRVCAFATTARLTDDVIVPSSQRLALADRLRFRSLLWRRRRQRGDDDVDDVDEDERLWLRYLVLVRELLDDESMIDDNDDDDRFGALRPSVECEYHLRDCLTLLIARVYAERKRKSEASKEGPMIERIDQLRKERTALMLQDKRLRHVLISERRDIERAHERVSELRSVNDALTVRTKLEAERIAHTVDLTMAEIVDGLQKFAEAAAERREKELAALRDNSLRLASTLVEHSRPIFRMLRTMEYPLPPPRKHLDDDDDNDAAADAAYDVAIAAESYLRDTLAQCNASGAFLLMGSGAAVASSSPPSPLAVDSLELVGAEVAGIAARCNGLKRLCCDNHVFSSTLKSLAVERAGIEVLTRARDLKANTYPDLLAEYALWRLRVLDELVPKSSLDCLLLPVVTTTPTIDAAANDTSAIYLEYVSNDAKMDGKDEIVFSTMNDLLELVNRRRRRRRRRSRYDGGNMADDKRDAILELQYGSSRRHNRSSSSSVVVVPSPPLSTEESAAAELAESIDAHLALCYSLTSSFSNKAPSIADLSLLSTSSSRQLYGGS